MSAPSNGKATTDAKAWIQELKTNRKTQAAIVGLVAVLAFVFWPDAPKRSSRSAAASHGIVVPMDDRQLQALDKLHDLASLGKAGELPDEGRMYRDVFLFDMPPPKPLPPPVQPKPPKPKPLSAIEIAAIELQRARDAELAAKPQSLHYLGYMGRASTGRLGAFTKGEETISLRVGEGANPQWKLTELTDTYAEFQDLKFPDLRHRITATDAQAAANANANVTNQF